MKSQQLGKSTSVVEIENISPHGIWLFVNEKEYFLPFETYPWFKQAKIAEIQQVELLHHHHLHWPTLDIDLELESLDQPDRYPLTYQK